MLVAACTGSVPSARDAIAAPPKAATTRRTTDACRFDLDLRDRSDAESLRKRLAGDFTQRELDFVGFDDVSLGHCIEDLVAAELAWRTKPDEPTLGARRAAAIDAWVAAATEAQFRRVAGAASCIPSPRD